MVEAENAVVRVPLTRGLFALIDAADAPAICPYKWYATRGGRTWYASRTNPAGGRPIAMHRQLLGPTDRFVDHVSGDGLDNRRANLRLCSHRENIRNQRKRDNCSSVFKGVCLHRSSGRWRAEIEHDGDRIHLGTFKSERDAALQYDRAARLMFGRFARTNAMLGLYETAAISMPRNLALVG